MKSLNRFSLADWLRLEPLRQGFKQVRNDAQLALYLRKTANGESGFIDSLRRHRNVLCVIAFEQPLALHWLLSLAKHNVPDFTVLVFDNSLRPAAREDIRKTCELHGVPYLSLPTNRTRHVNRSHGLAMTWVFEHVIRKLEPDIFGFIDHDMIPVAPVNLAQPFSGQDCYGLINAGDACWNLWAGYCLFRYARVRNLRLNFLYDFSRGLDTGGRNWAPLYANLDKATLRFAPEAYPEIVNPLTGDTRKVQCIDNCWFHIGGIGYNNNFDAKRKFFGDYFKDLGINADL